jgi:thiol-disulfide isomerase/thioredoxin
MRALRVVTDGRVDEKASLFIAEGGVLLAVPSKGDWAFVVWVKEGRAAAIARSEVALSGGLPALEPSTPKAEPVEGFRKAGSAEMEIFHRGLRLQLTPTPALVGEVTIEQIVRQRPDYLRRAEEMEPDAASVAFLRSVRDSVEIAAFFGTWCPTCADEIPRLMKTLESADNKWIKVRYFAVSQDLKQPQAEMSRYGISATPSLVVFYKGREVGRIIEHPETTVEKDIAAILNRARG